MSDVVDRPESNAPRADGMPSDAVEASAPQQSAADPAADLRPASAAAPRPRRRTVRRVLLALGPIVVLVGAAYAYLATGRFVSTDNAYVKSDVGVVSAQISGPIVEVAVRENESVSQGDVLFKIDETPFRVKLDQADAQLGAVHDYVEGIRASYRQKLSQLDLDKTNAAYQRRDYERLQALASRQLASQQSVDDARNKSDVANQTVVVTERSLDQIRAQLGGDPDKPLTDQAAYLALKAMRDSVVLDLERTVVRAPFDGVASKVPMLGHYVAPGGAVMSVVSNREKWVEANFKETDLTHVVVGQPVTIKVDAYPDLTWQGRVQSIAEATGAEFSVIPAQNATGNWVKVTQRIPVRIAIQALPDDPELRVGMSTVVEIDTGYQRPAPAFLTWLRPDREAEAAAAPVRLSR
ncbi:MAG TPA: HlyD family secretion protein [Gammaproteobacteria bacterium]|nr:HlyD family secretion protein [Gammaproteobacteria bacterium]